MQWIHSEYFENLSPLDLYQILRLRQNVFIIEQECIYNDIDNLDPLSEHLLLKNESDVIGCLRIVPEQIKFDHPSIGRVAVHKEYRRNGLGKELVQRSMDILSKRDTEIVIIEAQRYLKEFYESLGFRQISESYTVDGIPHIKMDFTF